MNRRGSGDAQERPRRASNGFGMTQREPAALFFEDVSVALNGISILDKVRALVPGGQSTAIVGPNGAGKTTLLLALLGRIPYKGFIRFYRSDGVPVDCRPRVGYVPQRLAIDRGMPLTVQEFLVIGCQRLPVWLGCRARHRERAYSMLQTVDAAHLAQHTIGNLSGGELQRILLALALQRNPELLVLDEPSAGVDVRGEKMVCELLDQLRARYGFTQLMVTHDLATVGAHAEHVICLNHRVTGEGTPRHALTTKVLTETYGIHMGTLDPCGLSLNPCLHERT